MHDAGSVGFGQALSYLLQILQQPWQFATLLMDLRAQRNPLQQFHRDVIDTIALTDLEDLRDVWMTEGGSSLRLLLKPPHSILIVSNSRGQYLQRHLAMQPHVFS